MRFEGQVAIVTAAANGIGRATADMIAGEGGTVFAVDLNLERLEGLAAASDAYPGSIVAVAANALDQDDVAKVVEDAINRFDRIDVLANVLGGSNVIPDYGADTDTMTLQEWEKVVSFNMTATFLFTNAVIPHMKKRNRGKIVNVSSFAASGRGMTTSAYAAAKGGIMSFTRKVANEVGPYGINVNGISPGGTKTERAKAMLDDKPEVAAERAKAIPLRRLAEPSDQANAICFLASSQADYITGVTIDVTGGL